MRAKDANGRVIKRADGKPKMVRAPLQSEIHGTTEYWSLRERRQNRAAFWQRIKDEREAAKRLEEEAAMA